ncbi:T6SS immunity protein Tdi1 domain-containing protein [Pseudoalteromonas sp. PPB1]|uniref:T6SS immunity protein Tdi1 domain-containing protein n=1 Tax=Pseudoalteromonas sp. PPB1 TaxID=2756136 RepID=UPI0018918E4C|nr:T6SS immunity protein Tdi1 domain-containing protein [Pseudoalteromonas sp. PPB1]
MNIIQEIKESWGWVGIDPVEVVGENDFGNLMIKDSTGCYWRLCPEDVYCEIVATNREELDSLSTDQEFLEDWYMQALVEQASEHIGALTKGQKYCLVTPGALGGEYAISNIKTAPLHELIRFSGHVAKQIKDLPDGAQIQLRVTD